MSDALHLESSRATEGSEALVIVLNGRLDGNQSVSFAEFVKTHHGENDLCVVLDCSGLAFISSAGLREFLNLAKRLNKHKRKAALVGMEPSVALAVEIAGFNTLFHRCANVPEALRILSPDNGTRPGLLGRLFSKG